MSIIREAANRSSLSWRTYDEQFRLRQATTSNLGVGSIPIYGFELWQQTITSRRQNPMSIELLLWISTMDIVPLFIANSRMHVRIAGELTTGGRHASS